MKTPVGAYIHKPYGTQYGDGTACRPVMWRKPLFSPRLKAKGKVGIWDPYLCYFRGLRSLIQHVFAPAAYLRLVAASLVLGILAWFMVMVALHVVGIYRSVEVGVTAAAHGASWFGIGALGVQAVKLVSGMAPMANCIHRIMAPPAPDFTLATPLPPEFSELDSRHISAVGCTLLSILGCIFGKP